mgnify:CR=1 FL=1|tara:strand:- start:105 stop:392 length:288 start_codon:yes stop_codon:yes gene_type:complete
MPERDLWCAVILRIASDSVGVIDSASRAGKERIKRDADRWFRSGGLDFAEVCWRAGFDPGFIRSAYESGAIQAWAEDRGHNHGRARPSRALEAAE